MFHRTFSLVVFLFSLTTIPCSSPLNFQLSRFSPDVSIVLLRGDAVTSAGEIEINKVNYVCRVGQVIYNGKVPLGDSNSNKLADFTTRFSFNLDTQGRATHGNGLAFFLAPVGFQIPPNSVGGFLGLFNTTTTDSSSNHIVTVEFDSFSNPEWDPPYEHVGINNNSIASSVTTPWNVTLHSGDTADVWITYNSTTKNLSVFWSYGDGPNSSLSYKIDLRDVLPQWITVGISAATGINVERHTLESWEFSSSLDIDESVGGENHTPRKNMGILMWLFVLGCVLTAGGVSVFVALKLRKWRVCAGNEGGDLEAANLTSMDDALEREAGPRRFSYKDLAFATKDFSNERKLGEGGFGRVYKGHLVDLDIPIAVKKSSRGSGQGEREYVTEVKIISKLRHKNLVKLIGWCHDHDEFLLVYEFMPKGSLDHHLFGRRNHLSWSKRYEIAQGLASALLYLHEECEQCVLHRDIKASNVMLDSSFNVKLGDFGLARLVDHELGPQTTRLAGTLGYLAPECMITGRASKEADIYSFGVVALEIATGRKSVDLDPESGKGLVEWLWNLYENGQALVSKVDRRLEENFDLKESERLIVVGLWCAHPDPSLRPSIREAIHVLKFEAELPTTLPARMHHAPPPPASPFAAGPSAVDSREPSITNSSINIGR